MVYAYIRVSKEEQNLSRQIDSILKYNPLIEKKNIYHDYKTGKTMDRPEYQKMKKKLVPGDELVLHELDRLGRDKDAIKDELMQYRQKGVIVRILNIPTTLTSFPKGQEWVGDMINNLLIEVYATIAQNERDTLVKRTKEGLAAAREKGNIGGNPKIPDHVLREIETLRQNYTGESKAELVKMIQARFGLGRSTVYKILKEHDNSKIKPKSVNNAAKLAIKMYQDGENVRDIQIATNLNRRTIYTYLKGAEKEGIPIHQNAHKRKTFGRPKIDSIKREQVLKLCESGLTRKEVSKATNISLATVYNILKEQKTRGEK